MNHMIMYQVDLGYTNRELSVRGLRFAVAFLIRWIFCVRLLGVQSSGVCFYVSLGIICHLSIWC